MHVAEGGRVWYCVIRADFEWGGRAGAGRVRVERRRGGKKEGVWDLVGGVKGELRGGIPFGMSDHGELEGFRDLRLDDSWLYSKFMKFRIFFSIFIF